MEEIGLEPKIIKPKIFTIDNVKYHIKNHYFIVSFLIILIIFLIIFNIYYKADGLSIVVNILAAIFLFCSIMHNIFEFNGDHDPEYVEKNYK